MSAGYLRRCAGKTRHEDKSSARGEKASICSRSNIPQSRISIYSCDQCLGYHVGGTSNVFMSRKRRSGKRPNRRMRGRI